MEPDLNKLRIDKSQKNSETPSRWASRWIILGIVIILLLGGANMIYSRLTAAVEVELLRVTAAESAASRGGRRAILNATGYIVAAHKIELASKVVGRVAWIGVEKGDRVAKGQQIVRLEDDEYRAQLQQARGQLQSLEARLEELTDCCGSSAGACGEMTTGNSMQLLTEALGFSVPGSSTSVAVSSEKIWQAKETGKMIVDLARREVKPSQILRSAT